MKNGNEITKKIVTIGGATQDIFIEYAAAESMHLHTQHFSQSFTLLGKGDKIEVNNIYYSTGGGATNSAVSFKRLGFDVDTFFKIAHDPAGNFVLDKLKKETVDSSACVINGKATGTSFIIPSFEGDRTIFAYRGANAQITKDEIPFSVIDRATYLYITSLSGISAKLLLPITQYAKEHNIHVANNPGKSQLLAGADVLRESLPHIDILILNADEAKQLMISLVETNADLQQLIAGTQTEEQPKPAHPLLLQSPIAIENICFNIHHFFTSVLERGPRVVVVTNGAEGVYVATHEKIFFHTSMPAHIVNTLGAGDAFGSCFVASIIDGQSVEQSMVNGIINASSVISYLNAKDGLLDKKELQKRAHEVGLTQIQTFPLTT